MKPLNNSTLVIPAKAGIQENHERESGKMDVQIPDSNLLE
jgi:hypothetical protein